MWAAAERHPDVVRAADRGRRRSAGPHEEGVHGAPLRGARGRHRERDACCCAAGVDVNIRSQPDSPASQGRGRGLPGLDALRRAARRSSWPRCGGRCPIALYLLEHGADPNAGDAGFTAAALGGRHVGRRRLEPGLRLQRSDERHSRPPGQAAAGDGAAGPRRQPERAHDEAAAGVRRRLRRRRGRHAVPAGQRRRGRRDDEDAAGRGRRSRRWSTDTKTTAVMAASGLNRADRRKRDSPRRRRSRR